GQATSSAVVDWASGWYEHIGKSVITMDREIPGFIANRLQEALWREALHMVANGEATVEQIDTSIADGPGLRWPAHGPMLTCDMAGGEGGMAHMLAQFAPSLQPPWTRLETPDLTDERRTAVVEGCDPALKQRGGKDLIAERDRAIIAIGKAIREIRTG